MPCRTARVGGFGVNVKSFPQSEGELWVECRLSIDLGVEQCVAKHAWIESDATYFQKHWLAGLK